MQQPQPKCSVQRETFNPVYLESRLNKPSRFTLTSGVEITGAITSYDRTHILCTVDGRKVLLRMEKIKDIDNA